MPTDSESLPPCLAETHFHPAFEACRQRVHQILRMPTSVRLLVVIGPNGAGKSWLMRVLCDDITTSAAPEMRSDHELIPCAAINMKDPGQMKFTWRDPYFQMLKALNHPFAETRRLRPPAEANDSRAGTGSLQPISASDLRRNSEDWLFRKVQLAIQHRRPKAVFIDEAQHLLLLASSGAIENQLHHLKFMADETRTLFVLFGTAELARLTDLDAAIVRRREVIGLMRYRFDHRNPEESLSDFARTVAYFEKGLRKTCKVDLLKEVPYLYQGSVGCVGVLRDWLVRAYCCAKEHASQPNISKAILEQVALPANDLMKILNAATEAELYFESRNNQRSEYLKLLGFMPNSEGSTESAEDRPNKNRRGRRRPGRRNPHNDLVGTAHLRSPADRT